MLRINRQSQLAKGLVFCVFPGADRRHELIGGGLGVTDQVIGQWQKQWNTTDQYTAPGGGYYIQQSGGDTTRFYWPWTDSLLTITTECTVITWILLTNFSNSNAHLLSIPYTTTSSWTAPTISLHTGRSGSTTAMSLITADAGVVTGVASDTGMLATDGIFRALGVTRSGTSCIFYKDGLQHGAAKVYPTAAAVDWGNHGSPTFMNRKPNSNGESAGGYCFFIGIWNRALSASEMYRFYINPFRILVPKGAIF